MRVSTIGFLTLMSFLVIPKALGATISTQFNTSDGFIQGDFNPVTLTDGPLEVTFSGGQQQQFFDLQSYNGNPAGYLFINGNFNGVSGDGIDDDRGLIDFNLGVNEVSFFAANRGNGAQVTLNIFGTDDTTLLGTVDIKQTSNQTTDGAVETMISSATLGGLIGSIEVDLPGPAANPPYVLAIDTFSASADIPEPASAIAILGLSSLMLWRRRQTRMG